MRNLAITGGARLLKALGNEKRLEVLFHLRNKEMNVGEMEKIVGISQSALSQPRRFIILLKATRPPHF